MLDEAVFHRVASQPAVWLEQLEALLEWQKRPNVTLQLLPFSAGLHDLMGGSLTVLWLANGKAVAYLEGSKSGELVEDEDASQELAGCPTICSETRRSPRSRQPSSSSSWSRRSDQRLPPSRPDFRDLAEVLVQQLRRRSVRRGVRRLPGRGPGPRLEAPGGAGRRLRRLRLGGVRQRRALSPARAGGPHSRDRSADRYKWSPRAGVVPASRGPLPKPSSWSPRVRGWSRAGHDAHHVLDVVPAHAAFFTPPRVSSAASRAC
ncbi:hypothetical protein SMICM304S_04139 [Streptomyces microflavus]